MQQVLRADAYQPRSGGTAPPARRRFALAVVVLAGTLVGPFDAAAVGPVGGLRPLASGALSLVPAHGTAAENLDRAGAIETARHVLQDLSAEGRIDEGWKAAAVAEAETRNMRVFKVWVVHFKSAVDVGGQGSDLYIILSPKGEFLKHSYDGP